MKTIKLLALLLVSGLWFAPAAQCTDALSDNEKRMIGIWEEYEPGVNVVQFYADHTMKIYLTEAEGKDQKMHFIQADWSLDKDNIMTLTITVNGQSIAQKTKVTFEKGEMWLSGDDTATTKQRKITEVPKRYMW
jgi:hypothetical protein